MHAFADAGLFSFCWFLRVEFLLKTDGGYPRDAGVFFYFEGRVFIEN